MHHALDTRYIVYLYTYISTQKAATVFSTYYVGTYYTPETQFSEPGRQTPFAH